VSKKVVHNIETVRGKKARVLICGQANIESLSPTTGNPGFEKKPKIKKAAKDEQDSG